MSKNKSAKYK